MKICDKHYMRKFIIQINDDIKEKKMDKGKGYLKSLR